MLDRAQKASSASSPTGPNVPSLFSRRSMRVSRVPNHRQLAQSGRRIHGAMRSLPIEGLGKTTDWNTS